MAIVYGDIAFCPAGSTALRQLGFALDQADTVVVDQGHPDYVAARSWYDNENTILGATLVTLPGTGACEQYVAQANDHIARINALIKSVAPTTAVFQPGMGPPQGSWETITKLGLTAAIVLGVAYLGGPIIRAVFSRKKR